VADVTFTQEDRVVTVLGAATQVSLLTPDDVPARGDIVLLHQGLGSITQWGPFPLQLATATGCRVVAYDRIGYGRSDYPAPGEGDFLEVEARERLPALLDVLGIDRPVLYGHSDGGTIALMFASHAPDRAAGLVSEAGHVFSEVAETGGIDGLRREFFEGELAARLARHHPRHLQPMFRRWADFWQAPGRDQWNMLERLAAIRCPVLVIQGEDDEHGTLRQVDEIIDRVSGPAERLILPGCGHSPHREMPEALLPTVQRFVAGLDFGIGAPAWRTA